MTRRLPLVAVLLVAGCAQPTVVQPPPAAAPAARVMVPAGLEGVMGKSAQSLQNQFGAPALDVREGRARKLQFAGPACILDAYLYPPSQRAEPIVTHVDARYPDGRDYDRAACVASLSASSGR